MASTRPVITGRLGRVVARLAGAVAAAQALVLLVAGTAMAQATTSSTVPRPGSAGRRVNLVFVLVAVGGALLIVLLQRRAARRLNDLFPTDPDDGAGKDARPGR